MNKNNIIEQKLWDELFKFLELSFYSKFNYYIENKKKLAIKYYYVKQYNKTWKQAKVKFNQKFRYYRMIKDKNKYSFWYKCHLKRQTLSRECLRFKRKNKKICELCKSIKNIKIHHGIKRLYILCYKCHLNKAHNGSYISYKGINF